MKNPQNTPNLLIKFDKYYQYQLHAADFIRKDIDRITGRLQDNPPRIYSIHAGQVMISRL